MSQQANPLEQRTMGKVSRRLIPFLFLLFVVNYLDRVNVGFASLQMNADLGLSAAVYGFGAGVFFLGYFLFEVPSNLILERVGARYWITRITLTWGLVSAANAFIADAKSFYAMRFLLGLTEAGFLPGVILYMTYWFPARYRAGAVAMFMTSTAASIVIGAPLSGIFLNLDGLAGLRGWQWLFILEGLPSVILGVVTFFYLTDRPEHAKWLQEDERKWLAVTLQAEHQKKARDGHTSIWKALRDWRVTALILIVFCLISASFGVVMWLAQIVKGLGGLTPVQIGLLSAIPYAFAMPGMVLWARRSDRMHERRWHFAGAAFVGALGLAVCSYTSDPVITFIALCVTATGVWSTYGVFWTLPTTFLMGTAAAGGIAFINSFGNLGGFAGPFVVGWIKQTTQSFAPALLFLSGLLIFGGALALLLPAPEQGSVKESAVSEESKGSDAVPA
jgi:MFS transporter, ACS family, tartrate transporter